MLPFLKKSQDASVSMSADHKMREPDEDAEEYDSLHSAAEDLIKSIHSKDIKSVAEALRAAFELCDSEPHEEGEHV